MENIGRLALLAAGVLFVAFFSNVAMGAIAGNPPLGDVPEMLTLLASAVLFAVAVLRFEIRAQQVSSNPTNDT